MALPDGTLAEVIHVGGSVVRPSTGELVRDGRVVPLGRRTVQLLVALAEADGALVSNRVLLQKVWPGSVVEQNTLQVHISSLRKALGPDRDRLKTYSGRGYKLETGLPKPALVARPAGLLAPSNQSGGPKEPVGNLPSFSSQLIGRESEVELLMPLLKWPGVVTLTGPGGIGKTRLGVDVARRSQAEILGGTFFVDLAPVVTESDFMTAVISSIGTERDFHASIEDRVKGLGPRPTLVILDNCEHVIDVAAAVAEIIVRANAAVTVLATSREPLRVEGERIFRVPALALPSPDAVDPRTVLECGAIKLFVARSVAAQARLTEGHDAGATIANICRRLDGNSLAIELAAARTDSLGIEEVAARIGDCLDILVDGRRTAMPRHQTLRATLAWSYGLLEARERALFRRLAVFAGGFTLASANRVASGGDFSEADVVELVSGLVNKSLVAADADMGHRRYRLLETTRAYALEQLAISGELNRTAAAHASHYAIVLDTSGVRSSSAMHEFALKHFRPEIDNVRVALKWTFSADGDAQLGFSLASVATPLMYELQLLDECAAAASRALTAVDGHPRIDKRMELRIRTSLAVALVYLRGPTANTISIWNEVLTIAREVGEVGYEVRALWGLWTSYTYAGRPSLAMHHGEAYKALTSALPSEQNVPRNGDRILGISRHYLGDQPAARRDLDLFISRYDHGAKHVPLGNLIDHATLARATLARTLWFAGFVDRASEVLELAVTEALTDDNALAICYVTVECALPISLLLDDTASAHRYLLILRSASERHGSMFWKLLDQCYTALLRAEADGGLESLNLLRRGIQSLHALCFDTYSVDLRNRLAHLLHRAGRVDEALALTERTLERLNETQERLWEPELLRTRAWLHLEAGAPGAAVGAEADLRKGLELAQIQGSLSLELRATYQLALLMAQDGRRAAARELLETVCNRFTEGHEGRPLVAARALVASLA